MDRIQLLQRAVEYEREGYDYYMRQSKMLHDEQICNVFKVVAQEELKHIDWLKAIISDQLEATEKVAFLVSAQPLRDVKIDWDSIKRIGLSDVNNVYDHAIKLESDAIDFYKSFKGQVKPEAEKLLDTIIAWEESHLELFKRLKENGNSAV
ncbi:ferritin family protein [Fusibacter sp. JL216-2]|uniref:ferritin family protein n=1 Tax=Fusibacter sp. JL216-2 TaxID=3071453 RepID=UPI003D351E5B